MRSGKSGNNRLMNQLFHDIYRGKRVFVTGHTGFKGSWLTLWLLSLGAEVTGYSVNTPTNPCHFEMLNLDVKTVWGDILDKDKLLKTIKTAKPDIVFHLAAQPIVRESYERPVETFETNIMGTVNVLESCRKTEVEAIVSITSDKCYQNNEWGRGYTEDDAMGGHDPYSASKGCAALVANAYRDSFFNPDEYGSRHATLLAEVRAGNVIGGGDWARDRLIPDLMQAANRGERVIIRSPRATRPWQHVFEPLSGYLQIGAKLLQGKKEFSDNWNFGPQNDLSLTVEEVILHVQKHWDKISYDIQEDSSNLKEAGLLLLNSSKAQEQLGWHSIWNADKTFETTTNWYKNHYQNSNVTSMKDLDEYTRDASQISAEWTMP